jgi:hypothetical protein
MTFIGQGNERKQTSWLKKMPKKKEKNQSVLLIAVNP